MSTPPALPFRTRLWRLWPYFRPTAKGLVVAIVATALASVTEPLIPALLKPLLDKGFSAQQQIPLWQIPVFLIGLFGLRGLTLFLADYALAWTAFNGTLNLRRAMFARLLNARLDLFASTSTSTLTNTLVHEVHGGSTQLVYSLIQLGRNAMTALALVAYLVYLNWKLSILIAVMFPAVALIMRRFTKRLHRMTVASQQATDELAYVVEENVLAHRLVRLHAAQEEQAQRFQNTSNRLKQLTIKMMVAASIMTPLTQIASACALSAVITLAIWQSGVEGQTVGSFVSFITAMLMLISPFKHLAEIAGPITRGLAALERSVKLIEETPIEPSGGLRPTPVQGHLQLQEVSLTYPKAQVPALRGVTLDIRPGEIIALVGSSGSGKTSLVNLLPRFLEPSSGQILLDGHALGEWDLGWLRQQFSFVSQDVILFNDSVAANVALGQTWDEARILQALRDAHLMAYVAQLPQGIHTPMGHNGQQLSGGQRQRMAIARAIYKNAPLLILDEATSALDSESERWVQQALEQAMQGRTSLIIAHRLSTIEHAHRIVVMDQGHVVEQGTHAELMQRNGLYARLHAIQFNTGIEKS